VLRRKNSPFPICNIFWNISYKPSTGVLKPYWVIFGGYAHETLKRAGDKKLGIYL